MPGQLPPLILSLVVERHALPELPIIVSAPHYCACAGCLSRSIRPENRSWHLHSPLAYNRPSQAIDLREAYRDSVRSQSRHGTTKRTLPSRLLLFPSRFLALPPANVFPSFEVDHVCNLTDVDDKIIARMARDGVSLKDLTAKFAQLFFDDLASLNIVPASRYPRATDHIDDIVEMVQV